MDKNFRTIITHLQHLSFNRQLGLNMYKSLLFTKIYSSYRHLLLSQVLDEYVTFFITVKHIFPLLLLG